MRWARLREDTGASLISTVFGFLVFMVAFTFAVHFMILLYAQSVAADAALVGAHKLAGRGEAGARSDAALGDAHAQARRMLGGAFQGARIGRIDGAPDPTGYVTFTVETIPYRMAGGNIFTSEPIVRSATVKIEDIR